MAPSIVIADGVRTPMAEYNGDFSEISATDLGVIASKEALSRSKFAPEEIDHVIFGNVLQTSPDAAYLARHVGLRAGVPKDRPAVTVNRLCGSGFEAIVQAKHRILLGEASAVLAGGAENSPAARRRFTIAAIHAARWQALAMNGFLKNAGDFLRESPVLRCGTPPQRLFQVVWHVGANENSFTIRHLSRPLFQRVV